MPWQVKYMIWSAAREEALTEYRAHVRSEQRARELAEQAAAAQREQRELAQRLAEVRPEASGGSRSTFDRSL